MVMLLLTSLMMKTIKINLLRSKLRQPKSKSKPLLWALLTLALTVALGLLWPQPILANTATSQTEQIFLAKRSFHLRNDNLGNPQVIEKDSEISLSKDFLKKIFKTENPTNDQIQRLMLNPGEVSKDIVTQTVKDPTTGRSFPDYFFPVTVKTKNGQVKTGKMALQSYVRNGFVLSPAENGRIADLRDQSQTPTPTTAPTGGGICVNCKDQEVSETDKLKIAARKMADLAAAKSNDLWTAYQDFARQFTKENKRINKLNAGTMKRKFVKQLVQKFGPEKAGKIMAALTGFGEAPDRENSETQIAEIAVVLKVIENRASANYNNEYNRTLRDIGVSKSADSRLTTVLSDAQFSVWNDNDNSLIRILSYSPDAKNNLMDRRMSLAFVAQEKIEKNEVEFIGPMAANNVYHYHANYVRPEWSRPKQRISNPSVRVKYQSEDGEPQSVDVNLAQQRGSRHIFYTGRI